MHFERHTERDREIKIARIKRARREIETERIQKKKPSKSERGEANSLVSKEAYQWLVVLLLPHEFHLQSKLQFNK